LLLLLPFADFFAALAALLSSAAADLDNAARPSFE
jgi:hypothetical protein